MTSVFRVATKEAIREILTEHGHENRFGLVLTEVDVDQASDKIVDLMETALMLRSKGQGRLEQLLAAGASAQNAGSNGPTRDTRTQPPARTPSFSSGQPAPFPKTRNAADIYDIPTARKESPSDAVPNPPNLNLRLPRTRFVLSDAERDRLTRP